MRSALPFWFPYKSNVIITRFYFTFAVFANIFEIKRKNKDSNIFAVFANTNEYYSGRIRKDLIFVETL